MGACHRKPKLTPKNVSPHELQIGDHILITYRVSSIDAIFVDDESNRCIYLDKYTGYVTETYLSTICKPGTSRLFRYDYSSTNTMSAAQSIANAKYFRDRGQFCRCGMLASSYLFAFHCKINKYTTPTPSCNGEFEDRLNVEPIPNAYIIAPTEFECTGEAAAGRRPQQTLLDKLKSIDTEIRSMQCMLSPDAGFLEAVTAQECFEERKDEQQLQQPPNYNGDVMHDINLNEDGNGPCDGDNSKNEYRTPQQAANTKDNTLTPMDTSMTLTPIGSHLNSRPEIGNDRPCS